MESPSSKGENEMLKPALLHPMRRSDFEVFLSSCMGLSFSNPALSSRFVIVLPYSADMFSTTLDISPMVVG